MQRDIGPWRAPRRHGGLTVTRGLEADAEQRNQIVHRAIEIREKRRRVLSLNPARGRPAPTSWPGRSSWAPPAYGHAGLPDLDGQRLLPARLSGHGSMINSNGLS
jgi:hypothetical protein